MIDDAAWRIEIATVAAQNRLLVGTLRIRLRGHDSLLIRSRPGLGTPSEVISKDLAVAASSAAEQFHRQIPLRLAVMRVPDRQRAAFAA